MKKTLLLLFLFATTVLSAQNVVNIQYSDSDDPVWKLKSYDAQKFCKLRDMKLHPIKWKDIEGVSDYIYFSIIFQ